MKLKGSQNMKKAAEREKDEAEQRAAQRYAAMRVAAPAQAGRVLIDAQWGGLSVSRIKTLARPIEARMLKEQAASAPADDLPAAEPPPSPAENPAKGWRGTGGKRGRSRGKPGAAA